MRNRLQVLILLAAVFLTRSAAGQAPVVVEVPSPQPARVAGPVVDLLAPSYEYGKAFDPLIAETALQLVSIDLAARYGKYARYWPIDQQKNMSADGTPRISLSFKRMSVSNHLRLERHGDAFSFQIIDAERGTITIWKRDISMPARTLVGLYVCDVFRTGKKVMDANDESTGVIQSARLNGRGFRDYTVGAVGTSFKPGVVTRTDEGISLTSFGSSDTGGVYTGPFAYTPVDGDFVMEAVISAPDDPTTWKKPHMLAGVMCRESTDVAAACAGIDYHIVAGYLEQGPSAANDVLIADKDQVRTTVLSDQWQHVLEAKIKLASGQEKTLASERVTCATWDGLVDSVSRLSDAIEAGIIRELRIERAPQPAAGAAAQQLKALAGARAGAINVKGRSIWFASQQVNDVVNASPNCPEAHYTAAFVGAMLACQDLNGFFSTQARYLAGPLSHWMLARKLSAPSRAEDTLAGAWLMLAAGYPESARQVLAGLPPQAQAGPEGEALSMFITRDYRPYSAESIRKATRLEQLAWIWSLQECGVTAPLETTSPALAAEAENCALLPVYRTVSVESGHRNTILGMQLSYAEDARLLLVENGIPTDRRKDVTDKIAAAFGMEAGRSPSEVAFEVRKACKQDGLTDENLAAALAAIMELYSAALEQPSAPVIGPAPLKWQTLSLHDYAESQRGLLLLALYRRAEFMLEMWGVPDAAASFTESVAAGAKDVPGAVEFFSGYAAECHRTGTQEAIDSVDRFADTPLSESFGTTSLVAFWTRNGNEHQALQRIVSLTTGRGSWDWQTVVHMNAWSTRWKLGKDVASVCLAADTYALEPVFLATNMRGGQAAVEPCLARMAFNMRLLTYLFNAAGNEGQRDLAWTIANKRIEIAPAEPDAYWDLMMIHRNEGNYDKAIKVGELAARNCEFSVSVSNMEGLMAGYLIQERRFTEALKWGRAGARSYSALGLMGLAEALEANGQTKDALQVWRACAERYSGNVDDYAACLARTGATADDVARDVNAIVGAHARTSGAEGRASMLSNAGWAFAINGADPDVLDKLYVDKLFPMPDGKDGWLFVACAAGRHWDKLAPRYDRVVASGKNIPEATIIACAASKLSDPKALQNKLAAQIKLRMDGSVRDACWEYALGHVTADDVLRVTENDAVEQAYAQLLVGAEAEEKGDLDKAVKCYKAAQRTSTVYVQYVASRWEEVTRLRQGERTPDEGPAAPAAETK